MVAVAISMPASIPKPLAVELDLPVSFSSSGEMVTLREFALHKGKAHLSLSSLTYRQRAEITVERLRRKPEVQIAVLGAGVIDKKRAIAEVEAQSEIGQVLIEAQQYVIKELVKAATSGRLKDFIGKSAYA